MVSSYEIVSRGSTTIVGNQHRPRQSRGCTARRRICTLLCSHFLSASEGREGQTHIILHASQISRKIVAEQYTPRTWRAQPLHICPPEPYSPSNPLTTQCLNWIFLISALNFSFWSEKEGTIERYGVEWRKGWDTTLERSVHTGYWSLVAALNRGTFLILLHERG